MAYVEVWKSGRLLTRRQVDEQKAREGCRIRLGSAGEVRIAVGQSKALGTFEIRMFEGAPPAGVHQIRETASELLLEEPRLPPLSMVDPAGRSGQIDGAPDIKGYKIIEPLGSGGMGTVWRAEQLSTHRQVALKLVVSHRIESPKVQALFQREVELTARLDHPNIARIYDSGMRRGMYYYAMELVDGVPLDQYVKSRALSRNQILALMQTVCRAVLFAHLRAVIHRDLKPSNILVSPDGQPHVLDFGLAKGLLEEEDALAISVEGQIAGTPAYMSPEQAAGHHSQLDTRTDVFSLGVILYELLTGRSPHDLSGSMFDVLRRITEGSIRRPREIDKSIDGELEAILLAALAHNPEDRYPSAGALAKDISNYLDGEPLDARVHTIPYFLCKKALKYRVPVAVGLAISLVLLGTILVAYTKVVSERAISESKNWEIKLRTAQLTWRELELKALSRNEQEARAALKIIRDEYVASQDEIGQLNHKLGEKELPVEVRRVGLQPGAALASTALVRRPLLPGGMRSWTLEMFGHRGPVVGLTYSTDGNQLISAGTDGTVRTWDAETGKLMKVLVDPNGAVERPWLTESHGPDCFSWSVDKAARPIDEVMKLWAVDLPDAWQPVLRAAMAIALSPDRFTLALGGRDGTIHVLDLKSGQLRYTQMPASCGPVYSICFSSDGKVLATGAGLGTISLWDAHMWQPLRKFEVSVLPGGFPPCVNTVAWGPGNTLIARPNNRQDALEILDSQSGQVMRILSGNNQRIASVSWSSDGTLLAAGTVNGKALVWDVKSDSGQPLATLDAYVGSVNALAWKPQDQSLITAGDDGKIEIWEPRSGMRTKSIEGYRAPITCLALSRAGDVLAAGSDNGIIYLWDAADSWTSTLLRVEPNDVVARESKFTAVAWSPDGTLLASGDSDGRIKIWDLKSRQPTRSFGANCGQISSLAWSPDGHVLVCGGGDGTARAWDAKNDFQEHVVLLPLWGSFGPGIAVNREGDYRGPSGIAEHLFYIVSTERGQEMLTPADFRSRFGWVNEPWQVGLYAPGAEAVKRIYVKASARPPCDGNSWDTAFSDLQDALALAQPNTEIWVAAGTYTPDRGTGAREASFRLKNGVRLFGGFAGIETSIDQRDPNRNQTILSGDLNGDDKPNFANNDENSYHVVVSSRTDQTALLDGFIIAGGNANSPSPYPNNNINILGGGILSMEGSPILINCVFMYNEASAGGGIYINGGKPTLRGCCFVNNISYLNLDWNLSHGGGICNRNANTVITNCIFRGNTSEVYGGAINSESSELVLTDCIFSGNSAACGGGMSAWADPQGGNTFLTNCKFVGNSAQGGGGIYCREEQSKLMKLRLINCTFSGNLATGRGGSIENQWYYEPILTNCTLVKNYSAYCGGICNGRESTATLTNCILWANSDTGGMAESAQIDGGTIVVNNCDIQGWTGKLGRAGNFGLDPLFVDPNGPDGKAGTPDDNLRLGLTSPCRNTGDKSALPTDMLDLDRDGDVNEPIPFDIEGKPRILNGAVDLGAYESG
jgi:predicted outer membrane repeat protein